VSQGRESWMMVGYSRLARGWARYTSLVRGGASALAVMTAMLVGGLTVAAAADAQVATVHCTNYYSLIHPRGEIFNLRIVQARRLVDGYAPRCLVAASVAASVVNDQSHFFSRAPRVYSVQGARWNAGSWRCTRTFVTHDGRAQVTDGFVTCGHIHDFGHPKVNTLVSTVRFGYHSGS
jgi:hypothetical protein